MVSQECAFVQTHQIVHIKFVLFSVYQLFFNKTGNHHTHAHTQGVGIQDSHSSPAKPHLPLVSSETLQADGCLQAHRKLGSVSVAGLGEL